MKIIAHRGASGTALENTLEAIQAALDLKVDGVEFDLRRTKDNKLIALHDRHTGRVSDTKVNIHSATLAELKKIKLHNGQKIPTIEEILKLNKDHQHIVIDIKDKNVSEALIKVLQKHPQKKLSLTGIQVKEMQKVSAALSNVPFYVQAHYSPFEVVQTAKQVGARGISLNMWLLNPLTYHLANRASLRVRVYQVNHGFFVRFIKFLYPNVGIFTNHPSKFKLKRRQQRKAA